MTTQVKRLSTRHYEIIRLHFLGKKDVEIASAVGITPQAIACILRSPLAQNELAQMQSDARAITVNTPLRAQMLADLNATGVEALGINRALMKDSSVKPAVRARIGAHFLDRIVFNNSDGDDKEGSYRDLLRKLDEVGRGVQVTVVNNVVADASS